MGYPCPLAVSHRIQQSNRSSGCNEHSLLYTLPNALANPLILLGVKKRTKHFQALGLDRKTRNQGKIPRKPEPCQANS